MVPALNLHRSTPLGLALFLIGLIGCGSNSPLSTSPINDGISGTRIATPETKRFSDLGSRPAPARQIVATFVLRPEQLQAAANGEVNLKPIAIGPSRPTSTPAPARTGTPRPGTYSLDDLSLILRGRIPTSGSVGRVELATRFQIRSTTQLIGPGNGVRLTIRQAQLQDAEGSPQRSVAAAALPIHLDFPAKDIIQGRSAVRSLDLNFAQPVDFQPRFLRLEVLLTSPIPQADKLPAGRAAVPMAGQVYQALSLGADPSLEAIQAHAQATGKPPVWVAFSHNVAQNRQFPQEIANRIREQGSVPYIQINLGGSGPEILAGKQDSDWRAWGTAIKAFGSPVIMAYTGSADLAPAHRRIIEQVRQENPPNLTWVFQDDGRSDLAQAYPGDAFADWLALEIPANPPDFRASMDEAYARLATAIPAKPILLASFRVDDGKDPAAVLRTILTDLRDQRWPRTIGFAWQSGSQPLPEPLVAVFKQQIGSMPNVLGRIALASPGILLPTGSLSMPPTLPSPPPLIITMPSPLPALRSDPASP